MVSTTDLPWSRTRTILLVLLFVACIVGGGPCLQLFIKHKATLDALNKIVPSPITVDINYKDVEITAILLFVSTQVFVTVSAITLPLLLQDVFHIAPVALARRLKLDKRPSSSTLKLQAGALGVGAIVYFVVLTVHTVFVLTRSATITASADGAHVSLSTIQPYLDVLQIDPRYRKTIYILPTAELTWTIAPVVLPTMLVTILAKRQRDRAQAADETPVLDGPHAAA
jgi:hypothetical protein